jgi:hypothetical protein
VKVEILIRRRKGSDHLQDLVSLVESRSWTLLSSKEEVILVKFCNCCLVSKEDGDCVFG